MNESSINEDGESAPASDMAAARTGPATALDADTTTEERMISYRQHMIDVSKLTYPIILSEIFQNTLPVVVSATVDGHLRQTTTSSG